MLIHIYDIIFHISRFVQSRVYSASSQLYLMQQWILKLENQAIFNGIVCLKNCISFNILMRSSNRHPLVLHSVSAFLFSNLSSSGNFCHFCSGVRLSACIWWIHRKWCTVAVRHSLISLVFTGIHWYQPHCLFSLHHVEAILRLGG